nr:probable membrane-associated kinase regulator 4 [Ipomoea trifida]
MCSVFGDDEEDPTAIFPADDLFYQGKLLPLSLQTLPSVEEDDFIIMDFASSTNSPPFKPCRLSFELSNNGFTTLISNKHPPGKFWSEKLRLIKKCLITKKLKASRAYLRSLFRKSFSFASCSDFEGSIEAAISHCKQSQELPNPRKSFIEAGHYHYLICSQD